MLKLQINGSMHINRINRSTMKEREVGTYYGIHRPQFYWTIADTRSIAFVPQFLLRPISYLCIKFRNFHKLCLDIWLPWLLKLDNVHRWAPGNYFFFFFFFFCVNEGKKDMRPMDELNTGCCCVIGGASSLLRVVNFLITRRLIVLKIGVLGKAERNERENDIGTFYTLVVLL
jgi:hypothetical protein